MPKGMTLMSDLSYTLFDRLLDMYGDEIKRLLSIQYRMHQKIMDFSSSELYESKLIAHDSVAKHVLYDLPDITSSDNTAIPLILFDICDTGLDHEVKDSKLDKRSTGNNLEVKIAIQQIKSLLSDGLRENQIGVITPYAAQVTKLRVEIGERWADIEIGTVDGFQGREKEAILLSLVRSNKYGQVGFLAEKRRLNVAMTRAKRSLTVICDSKTLDGTKQCSDLKIEQKVNPYLIDRSFLKKWVTWLGEESDVRFSKQAVAM